MHALFYHSALPTSEIYGQPQETVFLLIFLYHVICSLIDFIECFPWGLCLVQCEGRICPAVQRVVQYTELCVVDHRSFRCTEDEAGTMVFFF